ncbi:cuticle protein [Asbolus verrucosus]|uniref:Cuticle protein n=1 Tax=Asbolus verrucosus TaxID=1661398 RepID=A0A482VBQ8_ASBVE|nr:cuticle protein [Asbolus verrucosus]
MAIKPELHKTAINKSVIVVVLTTAALAFAEPPVPNSQYLPSSQYGAPRPFSPPSTQYGTPAQTAAFLKPSAQYGAPRPGGNYLAPSQAGSGGYGRNGGYDDQSEPANYNFEYHVQDNYGNDFGHEEARQGDVAQGKYYVLLPDGRRQVVQYVADNDGYKPKISYEQVSSGVGGGFGNGGSGGYPSGGSGGYPSGGSGGYPSGGNGGYQY